MFPHGLVSLELVGFVVEFCWYLLPGTMIKPGKHWLGQIRLDDCLVFTAVGKIEADVILSGKKFLHQL